MNINSKCLCQVQERLVDLSSEEKAASMRRYFPAGLQCHGLKSAEIAQVVSSFKHAHPHFKPEDYLSLCEYILANTNYQEEKLVAYALIQDLVKKHFDDSLLERFKYWLEHYADNWALVDDLCIKTIYNFFMSRPHLIETTQDWADSNVSWCRRASNVVWVKFILRKIGRETYRLDPALVFSNCEKHKCDPDEFVQKSVGWLLKVTAVHYEASVLDFLRVNCDVLPKATIRYAIEKLPEDVRSQFLSR